LIYPSRAAVLAAIGGIPFALLVAAAAPQLWYASLAWPAAVLLMTLVDALLSAGTGAATVETPARLYVGETADLVVHIKVQGRRAPTAAGVALSANDLLDLPDDGRAWASLKAGSAAVPIPATAIRRGVAGIDRLWLRWRGPLGLVWRQREEAVALSFPILPDVRPVRERGVELFARYALQGLVAQDFRGEGADFDALVEFRSGMDRRSIDWKQSARHLKLHAKEFRAEQNNQIVFAVDSGRQMSEPVAGLPRIDRAVSAMLLTAWLALKVGDRVALHAFDSRPRVGSGFVSGGAAFGELQRLAADIEYSQNETNYTFALTSLGARLTRRSMIILFTEFADPISTDFLVRAAARLIQKHLLLIVVLRDEELETIVEAPPADADDVTRAVTAAALLKDRQVALARLQHLGIHIVEAEHDRVGERLVAAYADLKRRGAL
jgi:uncharacterized protein (DUF58 family)